MTREEREKVIQHFKSLRIIQRESFMREGFDVAIKAVEQEPCEDAVSKKDVLSEIIRFSTEEGASVECQQLYCDVNNMPPITPIRPKGHWIVTAEEYYKAINEKGGGVNENTDYFVDDIACSECLAKFCILENEVERFDFCPKCGSDNREVEDGNDGGENI